MEKFKDIINYENSYQISNFGRVKSLDRRINCLGENGRIIKGSFIKSHKNKPGYFAVMLHKNNKYKHHSIHRLVALAFIPNPESKPVVNHKNGIKTDNSIENLEWCTYSEDRKHAYDTGLKKGAMIGKFGKDNPFSKPILQLSLSGELIKEHHGLMEAERETGISHSNISKVCSGAKWCKTAGGYKWEYAPIHNGVIPEIKEMLLQLY